MIDYPKHRERLARARKSLTRPHLSFSLSDAEELLDKAEARDKYQKMYDEVILACMAKERTKALKKARLYKDALDMANITVIDPVPVEEGK